MFIFQVSQSAFNGDIKHNPFYFQHFNLSRISVLRNDESYPMAMAIPVDTSEPYLLYTTTINALNDPTKVHFNAWEFAEGYMLMCFDLTNDTSASTADYINASNNGTLRITLDYSSPLTEPINVFCLAEFDDILTIGSNRTAKCM